MFLPAFVLMQVSLTVLDTIKEKTTPRLSVEVAGSTQLTLRPWDMQANATLTYVAVKDFAQTGERFFNALRLCCSLCFIFF